jgi:hypothetical protein
VIPNWLTFLGPELAQAAREELEGIAPAVAIRTLVGGGIVVRAARAPFVGLASCPSDLDRLPDVARALARLAPPSDSRNHLLALEARRLQAIRVLGAGGAPVG